MAVPALGVAPRRAVADPVFAYVGTYSPRGDGIALLRVAGDGALTAIDTFDAGGNPSWLALAPTRSHLYAVSETQHGTVTAFAIDRSTGGLTRLNSVDSLGSAPAYVSVHPSGTFVLVANYGSGTIAVFPVRPDGSLGAATDSKTNTGPPRPARAADDPRGNFGASDHRSAHVHMIACDPAGHFIFVNDAGLDRIYVWTLDLEHGTLAPGPTPFIETPPGSAPRHFVFHPGGRVFYDLFEQDSIVGVYDVDPLSGNLTHTQSISTLPAGFAGSNLASEIVISRDGRFIYAANRLHDSIAVFAVHAGGRLTAAGETWTRADYPRSIALDPSGALMYACNQNGDSITAFAIDRRTGALTFAERYTPIGSPAVIVFSA